MCMRKKIRNRVLDMTVISSRSSGNIAHVILQISRGDFISSRNSNRWRNRRWRW